MPKLEDLTPEEYLELQEMTPEEEKQLWDDWLKWAEACDLAAVEQYEREQKEGGLS